MKLLLYNIDVWRAAMGLYASLLYNKYIKHVIEYNEPGDT